MKTKDTNAVNLCLLSGLLLWLCHNKQCDKQAMFPGGDPAFLEFLKANFKIPKKAASMLNADLKVTIGFIVEKDGAITNLHYVSGDKILLDEAMRATLLMPPWIPGEVDGARVRAYCTLPYTFRTVVRSVTIYL